MMPRLIRESRERWTIDGKRDLDRYKTEMCEEEDSARV